MVFNLSSIFIIPSINRSSRMQWEPQFPFLCPSESREPLSADCKTSNEPLEALRSETSANFWSDWNKQSKTVGHRNSGSLHEGDAP